MAKQEYKIRNLKTKDIFKMSKILGKIDVNFKEIDDEGMSQAQMGMAMTKLVLENIHKAEEDINEFLGNLVGITGEEFGDLDIDVVIDIMKQFQNIKGLDVFFNSVVEQQEK